MKSRLSRILTTALCLFTTVSNAQEIRLLKLLPIYAHSIASEGTAGWGLGGRYHKDRFGGSASYLHSWGADEGAHAYKYHQMIDGTFSYRLKYSKRPGAERATLVNLGFTSATGYKHEEFKAVDMTLRPPDDHPEESLRRYNNYFFDARYNTSYFSLGFERIKKVDVKYAGFVTTVLINPLGFIVGSFKRYEEAEYFFTSSWYASALIAAPGAVSYTPTSYYSHTNTDSLLPGSIMQPEQLYYNKVGFKLGYEVSSLTPVGFTFGLEAGMQPNVFNKPGVYGPGFPDDNIYFLIRFGLTSGLGTPK